jgi:hypothetical protein
MRSIRRFIAPAVLLVGVLAVLPAPILASAAYAAKPPHLAFDGTPGTGTPPKKLGHYKMHTFAADSSSCGTAESTLAGPTGPVGFSPSLTHQVVGTCAWASWSNGYTGDVYVTTGSSVTLTLPAPTKAFYLYVEPEEFTTFTVTVSSATTTSGPVSVNGDAGATFFGFYATRGDMTSVIVSCTDPDGFAIGEFGIAK